MLIFTLRTDNPEAEIGIFGGEEQLRYEKWRADRQLSVMIHHKIEELLKSAGQSLEKIEGIVCYAGPGSFTGLRIGISVGNALAYGLDIPIVATQEADWIKTGIKRLEAGDADKVAVPHYGAEAHITMPRK